MIFSKIEVTDPSWYGFDLGSYELKHRLNFTKQKMKEELGLDYDDSKTVIENMFANQMDRIFDCGNWKFS